MVAALSLALAACQASSTNAEAPTLRVAELSTANYLTIAADDDRLGAALDEASGGEAGAEYLGPFVPADAYAAVQAGRADASSTGTAHFVTMVASGSDFTAFALERYSGDSQGIVAAPGSGIESLADLRGRTVNVGSAGGTGDYLLHRAFEDAGLDIDEVEIVHIAAGESAAAFSSGRVDAWATYDQYFAAAQASPGSTVLAAGDEIGSLNWSIHFASTGFARQHPEIVGEAYRALATESERAQADPSVITSAYEQLGAAPEQIEIIGGYSVPRIEPLNPANAAELEELAEQLVRYGFIESVPDLSEHLFDAGAES
ncbi:NrtA/SsuA/CpmA family ABC transporter substrate-binding protein [Sediminivirga luteola]|uniref:ABC transporter substrate-binding protein n=1 Tax=Sediminivirga luteola TaxID=1774748 RepID=A0A8J2XDC9_9MICO|nr:ABC transporter substrate-binding protein [Sediminivirga luteola]